MPINPKSLANLQRSGSKPGKRKAITVALVKEVSNYLDSSFDNFLLQMHSLSPKEYCDAYLKLMKLVLPSKVNIDVEQFEQPTWIIQAASQTGEIQ